MVYDPAKAHDYYERTKELKGREKGAPKPSSTGSPRPSHSAISGNKKARAAQDRVGRMRANVSKLKSALSEAESALSSKRQEARKTKKESSDDKSTAKEKRASQEYRDKNKASLDNLKKGSSGKKGGSSKSSGNNVSDMSVQDLTARVTKIRGALRVAKRLLSDASQELGQLAHSAIRSEPNVNEQFARFQSAERIPSK